MKTTRSPRLALAKLPARYGRVVTPFILSMMMTCVVSAISTLYSLGSAPDLFSVWIGSWAISWLIAFPTLFLVLPLVRRLTAAIVDGG